MFFSVICAEDAPFFDDAAILRESQGTFVGPGPLRAMVAPCSLWPRGGLPLGYRDPVASDSVRLCGHGRVRGEAEDDGVRDRREPGREETAPPPARDEPRARPRLGRPGRGAQRERADAERSEERRVGKGVSVLV